ncbi:hypothetical protein IH992_32300, partial [Candidatus Poribacteria bacterium]|nr:hypothetical protein [Candidatus Poribacteria bacterium]
MKLKTAVLTCAFYTALMAIGFISHTNAAEVIAVWTMDETNNGKEIVDATGNKHDGEILGKVKRVAGKIGKGVQFNGAGDH